MERRLCSLQTRLVAGSFPVALFYWVFILCGLSGSLLALWKRQSMEHRHLTEDLGAPLEIEIHNFIGKNWSCLHKNCLVRTVYMQMIPVLAFKDLLIVVANWVWIISADHSSPCRRVWP